MPIDLVGGGKRELSAALGWAAATKGTVFVPWLPLWAMASWETNKAPVFMLVRP